MGVRHIFYTDNDARDYAYNLRMAGEMFGVVGAIPNGLTTVYAYVVADSVDYNANKAGRGVIIYVNYLLFFSCKPR